MFKNILVSAAVLALVDARAYSNEAAYLSNQDKLVQIMSEESDSSDDEEENIIIKGYISSSPCTSMKPSRSDPSSSASSVRTCSIVKGTSDG